MSVIFPWIVWAFSSIFLLYQFLLQTSTSVMISHLQLAFQINAAKVGVLSSSFFYTYFFMQVPAGMLVDRFGARKVLAVCMIICAFAVDLFAHAHSFLYAELSRMLMGLVAAPAFAAALYVAANWFPARHFAFVAGLTETLGMIGGILGEVYLAVSIAKVGWRVTLWNMSVIGAIAAVLIWLIVRDRPNKSKECVTFKNGLKETWWRLKHVIGVRQVWIVGLFSGLTFALVSSFGGLWCVPYLQVRYGVTPTAAALASSMIFFGVAIGSPFLGWFSDHIGKRKPVMFYSTVICLICMLLILYTPITFPFLFGILFLLGASTSVYMLPFALARENTSREVRGTAMGFTNMLSIMIGSPLFQPLIGKLLELDWDHKSLYGVQIFHLTDYKISLSILPLSLFAALLMLFFVRETYGRDLSEQCEDYRFNSIVDSSTAD